MKVKIGYVNFMNYIKKNYNFYNIKYKKNHFTINLNVLFQDDIIPEDFRKAVQEEEKTKEMEDLYLPPRSRKTLQQSQNDQMEGKKLVF